MNRPASIALGIFLLSGAQVARAQQINPRVPPPPPTQPASSAPAAPAASPAAAPAGEPSAAPAAATAPTPPIDVSMPPPPPSEDAALDPDPTPAGPVFDPLHAQRSLDIGTFYMKKGSYDAAIERFLEAANYQPSLAMPWKLLGETYEKKREYAKAVDAYNKYLRILPHAADAAKIQKTISELQEKATAESAAH
jgi:tetratricopeptide (TPR) repeat protein